MHNLQQRERLRGEQQRVQRVVDVREGERGVEEGGREEEEEAEGEGGPEGEGDGVVGEEVGS